MKARTTALLLVAVLAFYMALVGVRGIELLGHPGWTARGLGLGVVLLPIVGVVVVVREVRFGYDTQRLGRALGPEDGAGAGAEATPLPRRPSGRIDTAAADAVFAARKAEVEAAPDDWRGWYRLAMAYADARDTPRARRAMRRAITLERAATATGTDTATGTGTDA